ncbi:MAG: helix-turn-helix domain-containing protein [Erythrobacter sp.]
MKVSTGPRETAENTREKGRKRPEADSVERALDQVGDKWSFLILREAYFGVRRFDALQTNTGAAPSILTKRLKKMVADGLLQKRPYCERPVRYEYRVTPKGLALYPAIILFMQWGDDWLGDEEGPPLTLIHRPCGHVFQPELRCNHCSEPVTAHSMDWRPSR